MPPQRWWVDWAWHRGRTSEKKLPFLRRRAALPSRTESYARSFDVKRDGTKGANFSEKGDVDDGPLLRKRKLVKGICVTQILICLGLTAISIRRARILLVLVPFFLSAGVLGYLGADNCRPAYIAAHFMGSGGLSLVFFLYILGESFLKRSGSDLYFFAISFPNDLFMLCTAGFSISLYFDLERYQKQLAAKSTTTSLSLIHI